MHSRDAEARFGAFNESGFSDPGLDREIEEGLETPDRDQRRRALQRLMHRAMEELVWIPLFAGQDLFGIDRRYRWEARLDFSFRLVEVSPAAGP